MLLWLTQNILVQHRPRSPTLSRSLGWVGEDPGNEVVQQLNNAIDHIPVNTMRKSHNHTLSRH